MYRIISAIHQAENIKYTIVLKYNTGLKIAVNTIFPVQNKIKSLAAICTKDKNDDEEFHFLYACNTSAVESNCAKQII